MYCGDGRSHRHRGAGSRARCLGRRLDEVVTVRSSAATKSSKSWPPTQDTLGDVTTIEQLREGEAFDGETFSGLDLTDADLGNKEFSNCTFRNMKLPQTRWTDTRLEDCVFDDCDLTRVVVAHLVFRGVAFNRCKMMGIEWASLGAHPAMTFTDCNLRYCSFIDLVARKVPFIRCAIVDATFVQANLGEAKFEDCQLAGTRFERCDLRKATFAGSEDLLLEPAHNQVQGASIPLASAVLLAASFGMKIVEHH